MHEVLFTDGRSLRSPQGTLLLDVFLEIWLRQVYTRGLYEPGAGHTVVDIGAHVGVFSVLAAASGATVLAYEPSTDNSQYLLANADSMSPLGTIRARNLAVGGHDGETHVYRGSTSTRNVLHGQDIEFATPLSSRVPVALVCLDTLMEGVDGCHFMKVDCEGAEYEIFKRASTSTLARVQNIAIEYHTTLAGADPGALERRLRDAGFVTQRRAARRQKPWGFLWGRRPTP